MTPCAQAGKAPRVSTKTATTAQINVRLLHAAFADISLELSFPLLVRTRRPDCPLWHTFEAAVRLQTTQTRAGGSLHKHILAEFGDSVKRDPESVEKPCCKPLRGPDHCPRH